MKKLQWVDQYLGRRIIIFPGRSIIPGINAGGIWDTPMDLWIDWEMLYDKTINDIYINVKHNIREEQISTNSAISR
jgi:hypothetical protein